MRIGHLVIDYYAELFIPEDKIALINQKNIEWYPVLNIDKANSGWVWFSNFKEYHKARKLLKTAI